MTPETPLTEVAHHLPPTAAKVLLTEDESVQQNVLRDTRDFIMLIEDDEVSLDPLTYGAVIQAHVMSAIPVHRVLADMIRLGAEQEAMREMREEQARERGQ